MRDFTQEFHGVTLRLKGIVRCGGCLHSNLSCLYFKWLLGLRCQNHNAFNSQCCSHIGLCDFIKVIKEFFFIHYLNGFEKASVVKLDEAELIGAPVVSNPAFY